jgi:sugar O-acyltransferase (sialic acid O-acetyltransferase NeuD family)
MVLDNMLFTGNQLLIVGAGGFAREVRDICDAANIPAVGYLVDKEYGKPGDDVDGLPILGDLSYGTIKHRDPHGEEVYLGHGDWWYVIAVGEPTHRYGLWRRCIKAYKDGTAAIIKHPSVQIGRSNIVLGGSILCGGSILTNNIVIHPHVHVNLSCTIGHDCVIEEFVTLSPGVHVSGNVTIGTGTFIGTGAVIVEKVRIGSWCHIGAGTVVLKDVPDNATVVGVPGQVVKMRENDWQLR